MTDLEMKMHHFRRNVDLAIIEVEASFTEKEEEIDELAASYYDLARELREAQERIKFLENRYIFYPWKVIKLK
jgi:hypothetical protein